MFKLWRRTDVETPEHKVGAAIIECARTTKVMRRCIGETQLWDVEKLSKELTLRVDGEVYNVTVSFDATEAAST